MEDAGKILCTTYDEIPSKQVSLTKKIDKLPRQMHHKRETDQLWWNWCLLVNWQTDRTAIHKWEANKCGFPM